MIVVDTSFLLWSLKHKIDFLGWFIEEFGEKPVRTPSLERELRNKGAYSRIALEIIKEWPVVGEKKQSVDDEIVALAEKQSLKVATQDRGLKKRLKNKAMIISIHNKKIPGVD